MSACMQYMTIGMLLAAKKLPFRAHALNASYLRVQRHHTEKATAVPPVF